MSALRRFIAGAICPQCGELDKLFVREEARQRICECVRCGHREVIERDAQGAQDDAAGQQIVRVLDRAPE